MSPISTVNLYFETALGTRAYVSPFNTDIPAFNALINREDAVWRARQLSPTERARELKSAAWGIIEQAIPTVAVQAAYGVGRTMVGTADATVRASWSLSRPPPGWLVSGVALLLTLGLLVLAVMGAVLGLRRLPMDRHILWLLIAAAALLILPSAEPGANARFRTGASPVLAILAAVGVAELLKTRGRRRHGTRPEQARTSDPRPASLPSPFASEPSEPAS